MTHASEQNQTASLFSTPDDFNNPEFRREIEAADIIIALDDQTRSMEVLWGAPILERLKDKSTPKILYLKMDVECDEFKWIRNEINQLKSPSSKGNIS